MNMDWFTTRRFWSVFNSRMLLPWRLPTSCVDITTLIYDGGKTLNPAFLSNPADPDESSEGRDCSKLISYVQELSATIRDPESKSGAMHTLYDDLIESFCLIHVANANVWDNEDPCREYMGKDNSCDLIPYHKRCIDVANQRRNDFVEKCDTKYYENLSDVMKSVGTNWKVEPRYASEGIGSLLDRLSINTLKLYHTAFLINKKSGEQRDRLVAKLGALLNQSAMLADRSDDLIAEMIQGSTVFIKFKQYKLYNSPETNPHYRTT